MAYALTKSVGPFSAGTRVIIVSDNTHDKTYTVEVQVPEPQLNAKSGYSFEDCVFDIEKEYVVKLRERETVHVVENRKRRRLAKQTIWNLLHKGGIN